MISRWLRRYTFLTVSLLIFVCGLSICVLAWRTSQRGQPLSHGAGDQVHVPAVNLKARIPPPRGEDAPTPSPDSPIPKALSRPSALPLAPSPNDICSSFTRLNYSSAPRKQERILLRFISVLHTVIPPASLFAPTTRNPCWYMQLSDPQRTHESLERSSEFTDAEANLALGRALLSTSQHLVCLPKIFFIGFPRSGSTQIYNMLVAHPDIAAGWTKEPHWWTKLAFEERFPHNVLAVLKYITHFSSAAEEILANPNVLAIDASQSTIWDSRMLSDANICVLPAIISSLIPDGRYIVAMREPGSRLFSDFKYLAHRLRWTGDGERNLSAVFHYGLLKEISTFSSCLQKYSLERCTHLSTVNTRVRLGVSLYYVHVAKWLRAIPRHQFTFVRTEDLSSFPEAIVSNLWNFLGLSPQPLDSLRNIMNSRANVNKLHADMLPATRQLLDEFFRPFNEKLSRLLNDSNFLWEFGGWE